MALLNRLFSSRKKQQPQKGYGSPISTQANSKTFDFGKEQVRVLLFRECERRGRKLLFDSKAVRKVSVSSTTQCGKPRLGVKNNENRKMEASYVEISNGFGYQYTRPTSDVKSLGEMIFGSVAMALRGSTFKVHVGGSPSALMLTKVVNSPSKRSSDRGLEDSYGSSINSMNDYFVSGTSSSDSKLSSSCGSCPLDVPTPSSLSLATSQFYIRNHVGSVGHNMGSLQTDSGYYTSSEWSATCLQTNSSFNAALSSPDSRKGSGGSLSSLRRRWLRTASTSLDLDSSNSLTNPDSINCSPSCGDEKPLRRTKLGITIIISLTEHQKETMQEFLLEHAALLESMVVRLQAAVERAYSRKELFVSMMFEASCEVKQSIEDLLSGPRLAVPLWLGLLSSAAPSKAQYSFTASAFMQELCQMLEIFDTKDTNFFMSTLITAVLTHHLGWIPTVTPVLHQNPRQSSSDKFKLSNTLSDLSKHHPYNPLWAQAMDLYGALGHPLKTTRTIVMSVGSNKNRMENIEKILRIISYFIRCAGIDRQEPRLEDYDFHSSVDVPGSPKPCMKQVSLSIDDRSNSSTTLRASSGKCSPHLNANQEPNSVCSLKTSDFFNLKPQSYITSDCFSSKSENALNIGLKDPSCEKKHQQPASKGLRRTMSYSSRISSAVNEGIIRNNPSVAAHGEIGEDHLPIDLFSKTVSLLSCDPFVSNVASQAAQKSSSPSLEKVIFVLGENEDLVCVKGKNIEDPEPSKDCIDGKGRSTEQPLSFSGSEVESGFSECESFELSPVRTASENLLTSNIRDINTKIMSNPHSKSRTYHVKYDPKNGGYKENSRNGTNKDESLPFRDINPKIVTVHPTLIQFENESDSLSMNAANLRSLARSLSVNLPVCSKSNKVEVAVSDLCMACGGQITDMERKENIHPAKESRHSSSRRSMKRIRRAHSSFCVRSQIRKSGKGVCQKCHNGEDVSEESRPPDLEQLSNSQDEHHNSSNATELPLPTSISHNESIESSCEWGIAGSLFGGLSSHYIPERVLQGCAPLVPGWEMLLRRDLALDAQRPALDASVSEAVAIIASVDSWEVQLMSSHTYVVDRPGTLGVRAGLSQLVANMLESVHHMWKLHASSELCLSFIESRLQELLIRSQALSDLLLTSEFCNIDSLTSSLSLEPNDVPLLLSVASAHSPEVTQRYGLSFR